MFRTRYGVSVRTSPARIGRPGAANGARIVGSALSRVRIAGRADVLSEAAPVGEFIRRTVTGSRGYDLLA